MNKLEYNSLIDKPMEKLCEIGFKDNHYPTTLDYYLDINYIRINVGRVIRFDKDYTMYIISDNCEIWLKSNVNFNWVEEFINLIKGKIPTNFIPLDLNKIKEKYHIKDTLYLVKTLDNFCYLYDFDEEFKDSVLLNINCEDIWFEKLKNMLI